MLSSGHCVHTVPYDYISQPGIRVINARHHLVTGIDTITSKRNKINDFVTHRMDGVKCSFTTIQYPSSFDVNNGKWGREKFVMGGLKGDKLPKIM